MSGSLIGFITLLASADTLSPTTLSVTIYMLLTEGERKTGRLLVYLTTVALFYFAVGMLLMFGVDSLFQSVHGLKKSPVVSQWMTNLGIALIIGSFFVPKKKRKRKPIRQTGNFVTMALLGVTTGLIEVGTALPYFTAIGLMVAAEVTPCEGLPILAGYNLIMVTPPLIFLGLHRLMQERVAPLFQRIQTSIERHTSSTLSWVIFIIGIVFVINAW